MVQQGLNAASKVMNKVTPSRWLKASSASLRLFGLQTLLFRWFEPSLRLSADSAGKCHLTAAASKQEAVNTSLATNHAARAKSVYWMDSGAVVRLLAAYSGVAPLNSLNQHPIDQPSETMWCRFSISKCSASSSRSSVTRSNGPVDKLKGR